LLFIQGKKTIPPAQDGFFIDNKPVPKTIKPFPYRRSCPLIFFFRKPVRLSFRQLLLLPYSTRGLHLAGGLRGHPGWQFHAGVQRSWQQSLFSIFVALVFRSLA
jgi:hypothetical protein